MKATSSVQRKTKASGRLSSGQGPGSRREIWNRPEVLVLKEIFWKALRNSADKFQIFHDKFYGLWVQICPFLHHSHLLAYLLTSLISTRGLLENMTLMYLLTKEILQIVDLEGVTCECMRH